MPSHGCFARARLILAGVARQHLIQYRTLGGARAADGYIRLNTQLLVTEESACCLHRCFMNLPGGLDMLVGMWRFYRNWPRPCRQKGSRSAGFLSAAAVAATMLINTPTRYQTVQKCF